jgi:hypothetical protein
VGLMVVPHAGGGQRQSRKGERPNKGFGPTEYRQGSPLQRPLAVRGEGYIIDQPSLFKSRSRSRRWPATDNE